MVEEGYDYFYFIFSVLVTYVDYIGYFMGIFCQAAGDVGDGGS